MGEGRAALCRRGFQRGVREAADRLERPVLGDEIGQVEFGNHIVRQRRAVKTDPREARRPGPGEAAHRGARAIREGADADQEQHEIIGRRNRLVLGRGEIGGESREGDGAQQSGRRNSAKFVLHRRHFSFESYGLTAASEAFPGAPNLR